MLNLSDTVKIAITITVFSTLMMMITCIWYKLSKLREVMDKHTAMPASGDLVSIGLPWRRESINSECSICKLEKGHCSSNTESCNKLLHKVTRRNTADQEECVFTGRLTCTIEYKVCNDRLVFKHIVAEDLFPWEYSSTTKTLVTIEFQVGDLHDKQNSEVQAGVHRVSYEHEFEFNLYETDLAHAQFVLAVWQKGDEECEDSLIGQCSVVMDTENITSAPGQSLDVSGKLFKQSVRYLTDGQYFNYLFRASQPKEERNVPTPCRKRADTWPKSTNECKMDCRMTKKVETEVLLSLSYLPTAERLSVVVMKAKNIEMKSEEAITKNKTTVPNPYVKVCLIYAGRKIRKKKTSVRRHDKNPVYNESMIFDVPANFLHKIGFLITIEHKNFETEQTTVLGRVVMGSPVHNNALRHWNQMLAFPRRPVAAWHKVFYLG